MGILDRLVAMFGNEVVSESGVAGEDESTKSRTLTNNAGGYYVCGHLGCTKKANWTISDHDCCGRCSQGRSCRSDAAENYDGPGSFAHRYFETIMAPGVCDVCGESPEDH